MVWMREPARSTSCGNSSSSFGASTATVSARPPSWSVTSNEEGADDPATLRIQRSKPGDSTWRTARPAGTPANQNVPSAVDEVVRAAALEGFRVTTAPETTAPCGSATRPVLETVCAEATLATNTNETTNR